MVQICDEDDEDTDSPCCHADDDACINSSAIKDAVATFMVRMWGPCSGVDMDYVEIVVAQVTALAKAYTRGNGFDGDGLPNADITAAIVTAAARLAANPYQFAIERPTGGGRSELVYRGAFTGWSTAELSALNRWRVRAM